MAKKRFSKNKRGGAGFWDMLTGKDAQYSQCKQSCDDQLKARKAGRPAATGGIMGSMGLTGAAPGGMMGMGSAAPSYSTSGYGSSGYGNAVGQGQGYGYGNPAAAYRPQQSSYSSGYYGGKKKGGKRKSCRGGKHKVGRRTRRR
jgi:hypothetical protein